MFQRKVAFEDVKMDKETIQLIQNLTAIEDVEETFITQEDKDIALNDVPERLQVMLRGRLNPSDAELDEESNWIFDNIVETL